MQLGDCVGLSLERGVTYTPHSQESLGPVLFVENNLRVITPTRIFTTITQKINPLLGCNDPSSNILSDYCLKEI